MSSAPPHSNFAHTHSDDAPAHQVTKIHLVGGEKGGVGKSLVARLLAQFFIDRQLPFVGFDTDRSHGALMRFYQGYASPVLVDSFEALDALVESAVEQPGRRVLVDLAAQTHDPLVRWIEESGVLDLAAQSGIVLQYWHVMDNGRDSVDLLARLLERFGPSLRYTLVCNELHGNSFAMLERSQALADALALGAVRLRLPRLHDSAMQRIEATNASFWAALNAAGPDGPGLGLMARQRLRLWLQQTQAQLASAEP